MLRKNQRTQRGAWRINTAQAIIFLIALGCGVVIFNAYQKSAESPVPVLGPITLSDNNPSHARYAGAISKWQARMSRQNCKVVWPYQGQDFVARVELANAIPHDVLLRYLVYLAGGTGGRATNAEVGGVSKADLSLLLQYLLSGSRLTKNDLVVLRAYLLPGQGLNDKKLTDAGVTGRTESGNPAPQKSFSDTDLALLRQSLQTKQPVNVANLTSLGLPDHLSLDQTSQVLSTGCATNFRTFYGNDVARRSFYDFVQVRTLAQVPNAATCIVHVFAPSDQPGLPPDVLEEIAQASASGVTAAGDSSSGGG